MDSETFLTKVYTAAFRLTGEEEAASDLALLAIPRIAKEFDWQVNQPVQSNMFQLSIAEVCKIYIIESKSDSSETDKFSTRVIQKQNHKAEILQAALMTLKPLERITVVWRDILGFQLAQMASLADCAEEELYSILSDARWQLCQQLKAAGLLSIPND